MSRVLFRNVSVFDGTSSDRFPAEALVEGNRIVRVVPAPHAIDTEAEIIDGDGGTLMPGLIEAHAHISFTHPIQLEDIGHAQGIA